MNMIDYGSVMAGAEQTLKEREDVVTIAKKLRKGEIGARVTPVSNGFLIFLGDHPVVCYKNGDVGLLLKTLYSSDLENDSVLKRLRRLMGYK